MFEFRKGKLDIYLFQLRDIIGFFGLVYSILGTEKVLNFVLWTVIGGRVGYHGLIEFCYDWLKLD